MREMLTKLFAGNFKTVFSLPSLSLPNTAVRTISVEYLWNCSNGTDATIPLIRLATDQQNHHSNHNSKASDCSKRVTKQDNKGCDCTGKVRWPMENTPQKSLYYLPISLQANPMKSGTENNLPGSQLSYYHTNTYITMVTDTVHGNSSPQSSCSLHTPPSTERDLMSQPTAITRFYGYLYSKYFTDKIPIKTLFW